MGILFNFFFLLAFVGCQQSLAPLVFEDKPEDSRVHFETKLFQKLEENAKSDLFLSFSLNLPTKIQGCGINSLWEEPNVLGFPHAWKFTILRIPEIEPCLLQVILYASNKNAKLNSIYLGSQTLLISQRLREDSAMLFQGCILGIGTILMSLAILFKIRFRLFSHLGMIFFLLTTYSFSVANSSLQILFPNTTKLWPLLFYISLYFLPYFFCSMAIIIFGQSRRRTLRQLQSFFLFFPILIFSLVPFAPNWFDFFFLLYHLFVSFAMIIFAYYTKKDWYSFTTHDRILILGILIFFLMSLCEIIISRYTGNMSIPLVPWGGFFLLMSLFSLAFSEYNFYSKRIESLLWIQSQRREKKSLDKDKRLSSINQTEVLQKLEKFMILEKGFTQEDLNLTKLAKYLSVRPDQLSALINETYKKSFNRFINEFRIKEVQRIIDERMDKINFLHLAFLVGFQSKSVFNQEFKRILGVTPSEYEKTSKGLPGNTRAET